MDTRRRPKLSISSAQHYIEYNVFTSKLNFFVTASGTSTSKLQMTSTGGTLHGLWYLDSDMSEGVSTSDRSLKTNIQPLLKTISEPPQVGVVAQAMGYEGLGGHERQLDDVLQQLRPVAYDLKGDTDKQRFGFIADEMVQILPQITRKSMTGDRYMGIMYQDMIAFLVNMMQEMFSDLSRESAKLVSVEKRISMRKRHKRNRRQQG